MKRREFLKTSAAAAAFTIVPRHVLGGQGHTPPSERVQIGIIGTGNQGINNTKVLLDMDETVVVAVCDPNEGSSDYPGGKTSGREPARKLVDDFYANSARQAPKCSAYADYRKMLEENKDIDAVLIAATDHIHAPAAMMAIKTGTHIYCQKPMTHSVYEARKLTEAAHKAGVITQMGNQGHASEDARLICEWIWDGAIGNVTEVHCWTDRPIWPQGIERPKETPPVPKALNWDLWLGPAAYRPYHPAYHPFNWRGWWDFGTGSLGDMGCHIIDPVFWALKLGTPTSVEASSTPFTEDSPPVASIVRYQFPARGDMPAVKMHWYDGGLIPPRPEELEPGRRMGIDNNGVIFVGDKGKLMCGCYAESPRLIPETKMKAYQLPDKTIPLSPGQIEEWVLACKGGPKPGANFDYAGPLTETVLLGNVAIRAQRKLEWDARNMKITNMPEANEFLHRPYRDGWSL